MKEEKREPSPVSISWTIKPHRDQPRTRSFYMALLGIMAVLLIFAIWQNNFLFGIFVIMATGTILFLSQQLPEAYSFELTDEEIIVGDKELLYDYDRFRHFDVYEFAEDDMELLFVFKEKLKPLLRVRIYRNDKEKIVDFLRTKLPRKKTEPSILDIFSKSIGI